MRVTNLCEFAKTGLLTNLCDFYLRSNIFVHCNIWHDKNLCGTNLCDWQLTHIIRINKSHA